MEARLPEYIYTFCKERCVDEAACPLATLAVALSTAHACPLAPLAGALPTAHACPLATLAVALPTAHACALKFTVLDLAPILLGSSLYLRKSPA